MMNETMQAKLAFSCLAALTLAACASTENAARSLAFVPTVAENSTSLALPALVRPEVVEQFTPRPSGKQKIDYEIIDEALDLFVLNGGPSLRVRGREPIAPTGSRFVRGHDSPFRLEGNKIFFSQFDEEAKNSISEYRRSLESVASRADITTLPLKEQLSYWYNLHNFVVIDEIARAYPIKRPRTMRVGPDGQAFHDAKIIQLGEQSLSLREIRNIVYAHWDDPDTIYGFFHGDLAGPSIQQQAYTPSRMDRMLGKNADEFVNSLRGVSRSGRSRLLVSPIYEEVRLTLFPRWPSDLQGHLLEHADEEVRDAIESAETVAFVTYEDRVADLAGGDLMSDSRNRSAAGVFAGRAGVDAGRGMSRFLVEYGQKLQEMRRRGYFKSKVLIIDLPTDDPDEVDD